MPTILDRVAKTWGDAARDVVLIVVSILIAFALDAWWQDRAERRVESEQIAALRSEFETARDTLKSMSEYLRGTTQGGQARTCRRQSVGRTGAKKGRPKTPSQAREVRWEPLGLTAASRWRRPALHRPAGPTTRPCHSPDPRGTDR